MNVTKLSVSVIIPNYNGKVLLEKHLPGLLRAAGDSEFIVVDDQSEDGSVDFIRQNYPRINVIRNLRHTGFAGSVNRGADIARGDIIILLNTDVEPEPDFLDKLTDHFKNRDVFAVGCLEKSHEKNQLILRGRGIAGWQKGFYIHKRGEVDKTDTAWVSGGSGAFRKSIWQKLEGMDELYSPFYWEDIDLSYRARKAGFKLIFEPGSIVHHYHETGAIKNFYSQKDVDIIASRNQLLFIWKNLTDINIWVAHLFWLPVRICQTLLRGNAALFIGFLKAIILITHLKQSKVHVNKAVVADKHL